MPAKMFFTFFSNSLSLNKSGGTIIFFFSIV
jgi:hypothetical protein